MSPSISRQAMTLGGGKPAESTQSGTMRGWGVGEHPPHCLRETAGALSCRIAYVTRRRQGKRPVDFFIVCAAEPAQSAHETTGQLSGKRVHYGTQQP